MAKAAAQTPYIDRGEPLPRSYGENRIVALARDPEHLFVYWDVESEVRVAGDPVLLRLHCLSEGKVYDFDPGPEADNWYLRVSANRIYRVELYRRMPSGELKRLASSNDAATPVRWSGESGPVPPEEVVHGDRFFLPALMRARPPVGGIAASPRPLPATPAPVPVPPPAERVVASTYARGPIW